MHCLKRLGLCNFKGMSVTGKIVTTLLLLVVHSTFLSAQDEDIPVFKQVTHPFMPPITSEYFFFSEDGLLWFSTAQGLTSFDGSDIVYHSSLHQSNGLGLNKISAMAEDSQHNLYLAGVSGLYYFDRKTKQFFPIITRPPGSRQDEPIYFSFLFIDNDGKLFAGSVFYGLFIYDPLSKQTAHYNIDHTKPDNWKDGRLNTIISFAAHSKDSTKLWAGTKHGIYLFDKKEKRFSQHFEIISDMAHKYSPKINDKSNIDVCRMDVANDSTIWFNSWAGGFARYNTITGKATIVFGRDALLKQKDLYYGYIIPRFTRLSEGKYLLGIHNGKTAIYDTRANKAAYFNVSQNDYTEEETRYISKDRKGNIWMLQRGFLYIAIPANLRLQTVKVSNLTSFDFNRPKLRGVYFDPAERLFYCGFLSASGIHVYDTNFIQKKIIPTSLINNYFNFGSTIDFKIIKDSSGRFWATGWKNHVMLPGEKKFTPIENKSPSLKWLGMDDQFNDIAATRNGNILIRRHNGIIYHINHTTLVADTIRCPDIKANGVEIKAASAWYDDKRDFVYLTSTEGIAQYNLGKKAMRIIPRSSLFGGLSNFQGVCAPALDATGRVWLMIPKFGVRVIDPVSLLCVDSIQYGDKGLMQGDYTAILGGSENYIVFHSLNGIVVYDYKKMQSFLFDNSNGLSSPDNKSFLYANGYIFIGQGSSRFEYFKLSNLDNYTADITPYLNTIRDDTFQVYTRTGFESDHSVRLPYFQNTLRFSFSAPEYLFPERVEYAYQLAPLEKEWHYTNYFNRNINYSKLSPGKYTFLLKSQMQGGNWKSTPVEYTILIVPAWWQTAWFKLLCTLLAAGLIIYLVQLRIRFVRKTERQAVAHQKELIELEAKALRAQMNPHFIFNSLNSIKSLINKNENEKAAAYLITFSKLIRTLFQNSDKREINLYEELETCRLYTELEKMRFGKKVNFEFLIDESVDLKEIKVPALILQPFIENAIWHGLVPKECGGTVKVSVQKKNGGVDCTVEDNGIGRELSEQYKTRYEATHQSRGIGLTGSRLELDKLMNNREDLLSITDIIDKDGKPAGTSVLITFKEKGE